MNNTKEIGKFSALLSLVEVGLGSFLHSLRVPLTGQILSLNQIFILSRASLKINEKSSPALISNTSALLKSLSPAGKKLTPMLAISAQGNLFSMGLYIFGNNLLGRLFGAILLSLWAYIQPLAIYLILFGEDLIFMSQYFLKKLNKVFPVTQEEVLLYLFLIVLFKILIALSLVIFSHFLSDRHFTLYENWAKKQKRVKKNKTTSAFKGALLDLLNPLFIISLLSMVIFFIYAKDDISQLIWKVMRPIAGAFILFYMIRVFPIERFVKKLKAGKYKDVLVEALKILKN